MCHMSGVRCQVSRVTCQVSRFTCHMSFFFNFKFFLVENTSFFLFFNTYLSCLACRHNQTHIGSMYDYKFLTLVGHHKFYVIIVDVWKYCSVQKSIESNLAWYLDVQLLSREPNKTKYSQIQNYFLLILFPNCVLFIFLTVSVECSFVWKSGFFHLMAGIVLFFRDRNLFKLPLSLLNLPCFWIELWVSLWTLLLASSWKGNITLFNSWTSWKM